MPIKSLLQNLQIPPESPRTPGISPMPSQPCITYIVTNLVLSLSTSNRSCVSNKPYDLVAATLLELSSMFHPNVTLTQTSPHWLPLPLNNWKEGENTTSPKGTSKKWTGAKMEHLELDTTFLTQTNHPSLSLLTSTSNTCSGGVPTKEQKTCPWKTSTSQIQTPNLWWRKNTRQKPLGVTVTTTVCLT